MRNITTATNEQLLNYALFNHLYTEEVMQGFQNSLTTEKERGKNKPYYRAYLNIVKRTASLINSLGIENPFTKCSFFYYLLWLGMFSKDQSFTFNDQERVSDISALGADIMLGKSACLNNVDMLSRVLRATGTESYIIGCDVPDIKANQGKESTISTEWSSIINHNKGNSHITGLYRDLAALQMFEYGNHAISIFAYKGLYYLADPTNLTFLSITDFLKATYTGEYTIAELRPIVTLMLENIDPKHFKDLIIKSFIYSDEEPLSTKFINHHSDLGKFLIAQNIHTINLFYDSIEPDIDTICKTLI